MGRKRALRRIRDWAAMNTEVDEDGHELLGCECEDCRIWRMERDLEWFEYDERNHGK